MRKRTIALLLCAITLLFALCSCAEPESGPSANEETPPTATTPEAVEPDTTEKPADAQGIPGSHYTDIVLNMEQYGLTEHRLSAAPEEAKHIFAHSTSASCDNATLDAILDYSITIDKDFQIIGASFGVSWQANATNEVFIAGAMNYLGFAATVPYDTSDSATAKKWVQDNIPSVADGESVSTVIGDAKYELYGDSASGNYTAFFLDISIA